MSKCLVCNIPKKIMDELKVDYSYLRESDMDIDMKDLVLEANHEETNITFLNPFVYMFDFEEEMMTRITQTLKLNGINAIYAASTTHNLQWSLKELLDELNEEHEVIQTIVQLQTLIKKTMTLPMDENAEKVKKVLMASFIALQKKDLTIMKQMIQELLKLQKKSD